MRKITKDDLLAAWKLGKDISSAFIQKKLQSTSHSNSSFEKKIPLFGIGAALFAALTLRANEEKIRSVKKSERSFLAKFGGRNPKNSTDMLPKKKTNVTKRDSILFLIIIVLCSLVLIAGILYLILPFFK